MSSNALRFEIATVDQEAAAAAQEYDLHIFELPGYKTDIEYYAAIRPASDAWVALSRTSFTARQDVTQMGIAGMKFLDECLTADDLRDALLEAGEGAEPKWLTELREQGLEIFADPDNPDDGDGELSAFGLELADSNNRINNRLTNRRDPFGLTTLVDVYLSFVELWSGNPTSSPQDYLPPQKPTGAKSTGTRSSKGSTSRKSSGGRPAGSARRSTSSSRGGSRSRSGSSSTSS